MQKLLLLLLASLMSMATAGVYQIPLRHIESRMKRMIKDGTWPAYFQQKQLMRTRSSKDTFTHDVSCLRFDRFAILL